MANESSLHYAWLTRVAGLFSENESSNLGSSVQNLMKLSVPVASSAGDGLGDGVSVAGRLYHAIQVTGIAGSDVIDVQATLDAVVGAGTVWAPIVAGLTGINANGIIQFTGVFSRIRAKRASGSGSATIVNLVSRA